MDPRMLLIWSFGAGVVLQAIILMHGDWDWGKLAGCIALALLAFVPHDRRNIDQPLLNLLIFFSMFACVFAFSFMKDILQVLSPGVVLSHTLVFWFAFFAYFYDGTIRHQEFALLALLPSIASVIAVAWKGPMGFVPKLALYTWFLIVIVCLGLMQFPFSQLAIFFTESQIPWTTPLESLAAGMAFMFLLVNATYVYSLIPIPGKTQSWADRAKEWHEFTDELTRRVGSSAGTRASIALVIGVEAVALLLNAIYRWLPPALMINLAIVLAPMLLRVGLETAPAVVGSPPKRTH